MGEWIPVNEYNEKIHGHTVLICNEKDVNKDIQLAVWGSDEYYTDYEPHETPDGENFPQTFVREYENISVRFAIDKKYFDDGHKPTHFMVLPKHISEIN